MTDSPIIDQIGRYVMAHGPLLLLLLDADGCVREVNRYTRELLGDQLAATEAARIFINFERPPDPAVLSAQPERGHLLHVQTAAGLPESFTCHFLPLGPDTLVLGAPDAAATSHLRKELLVLNNQLNALTRELQQKNHELARLNQLKNQFLGMAAHDLRKPVSAVLNYAEFLIDETAGALSEEHQGFLHTIHAATALMRRLIDDFLDVSLIEADRFQLNLEPTTILQPVQRSAALNRLPARRREIEIELLTSAEVPVQMLDGAKIEQVVNNLVGNAIEHAPRGSRVTIAVAADPTGTRVTVTDTGPGLTQEVIARLFTPYARGPARKAAGYRSTGLGLAISNMIIEAHHGTIWVESRPGEGTTFGFTLPAMATKGGKS